MAVPGFSVTDLIQAAGHVKNVYGAFFDRNTNSPALLRDLADDIAQFQINLSSHRDLIERQGELWHSSYNAINRTLFECSQFLDKYKALLDDRKLTPEKAWKIARYAYDQDQVTRLREQISRHRQNLQFDVSVRVLANISRRDTAILAPESLPIPSGSNASATASPLLAPLSESPQLHQNSYLSTSPNTLSTASRSPSWESSPQPNRSRQDSVQRSPRAEADDRRSQAPSRAPSLFTQQGADLTPILPQPALSYEVAQVFVGTKLIELKRKPAGRSVGRSRELIIIDEKGTTRFSHKIKLPSEQSCYPYTWHSKWTGHEPLEITFKALPAESHSIKFKGQQVGSGTPVYIFANHDDYKQFQSEVRGRDLIDYFECRDIKSGSSSKNGEAKHQHLKIWRDRGTLEYSISFFPNSIDKPRDFEFPISAFNNQDINLKEGSLAELDFTAAGESRSKSSNFLTRRSTAGSSIASSPPSVFSSRRKDTGFSSTTAGTSLTMTSTASTARMSVASFDSQTPTDGPRRSMSTVESQARNMKYLRFEFSKPEEATRFKTAYEQAYKDETTRSVDFLEDWRLDADASMSDAPFAMSPVLGGQQSPVLHPQR